MKIFATALILLAGLGRPARAITCDVTMNRALPLTQVDALLPLDDGFYAAGTSGPVIQMVRISPHGHLDFTAALGGTADDKLVPRTILAAVGAVVHTVFHDAPRGVAVQETPVDLARATRRYLLAAEKAGGDILEAAAVAPDGRADLALTNGDAMKPRVRVISGDRETVVAMRVLVLDAAHRRGLGAAGVFSYSAEGGGKLLARLPGGVTTHLGARTARGFVAVGSDRRLYELRADGQVRAVALALDGASPRAAVAVDDDTVAVMGRSPDALIVRFVRFDGKRAGDDLIVEGFEDGLGAMARHGDRLAAAIGGHVMEWRCSF